MRIKILVLWFSWLLLASVAGGDTCQSKALYVIDGDTIKAYCHNQKISIRLAAIDAPEKKQAFGQEAKLYLAGLLKDQLLTIEIIEKDRYGRLVGNIFVGQQYINAQMVQSGYAWIYPDYQNSAALGWLKRMLVAQANAKKAKCGLWKDPKPETPWYYRKHSKKRSKLAILWEQWKKRFNF